MLNDDSSWAEVVSSRTLAQPLRAYNLTIKDFHTYFVAANKDAAPVWVHNACWDNYRPKLFQLPGGNTWKLDAAGLKHMLLRHHPDYTKISKGQGTLFSPDISVLDIQSIIGKALRENPNVGSWQQIRTVYNGVTYVVGTKRHGIIGQLYPLP